MSKLPHILAAVMVILLLWVAVSWINKEDQPQSDSEARTKAPAAQEVETETPPGLADVAGPPARLREAVTEPMLMNFDRRGAATALCWPPELLSRQDFRLYAVVTNQKGTSSELRLTPDKPQVRAGLIKVEVNSPDAPVVLLLNNYHSTLWNISVTPGTEILAVMASGYENQAVAGVKPDVLLVHASDGNNRCHFKYRDQMDFQGTVIQRFGRPPDMIVEEIQEGRVSFGPPPRPGQELVSYGDLRLSKLDVFARPLEALAEAVGRGEIRPATTQDIRQWQEVRSLGGQLEMTFPPRINTEDVFVVLDPAFAIPENLYQPGDQRAARIFSFLIPPGWPVPEGDLANARLQFLEDGRCLGDGCEYGAVVYHTAGPPQKPKGQPPLNLSPGCRFQDFNLPDTARIYAGGAYSAGRRDGTNISTTAAVKTSGSQAFPGFGHSVVVPRSSSDSKIKVSVMEVAVSDPGQTVALILGCYEATIWNIRVQPGTTLAAVVLTGYHSQRVGEMPDGVPVLSDSYDDQKCWSAYFGEYGDSLARINQLSDSLFGRRPDRGFLAQEGRLTIDPRVTPEAPPPWPRHRETEHPEMLEALRQGLIRPLTPATAEAWRQKYIEKLGIDNLAGGETNAENVYYPRAYEILSSEFVMPAGLVGMNAADFYVPEGFDVPKGSPDGKLGHTTIYLLEDGTCLGSHPACRFMR